MKTDSYKSCNLTELQQLVQAHLGWNKTRALFLINFIVALIKVRTVCLTEIAVAFSGKAKMESKYKTLQRFFRSFEIDFDAFARILSCLIPGESNKPWLLTIDRTNWKFGKADINIFLLAVAYKGVAFPLIWMTLSKRGNSNTPERIKLIERFIKLFGTKRIQSLTADREFVGFTWFSWLMTNEIPFCIRIRHNFKVMSSKGNMVSIKELFKNLKRGKTRTLRGRRKICGVWLNVIGTKLPDGSFLIVVTNVPPETALEDYKKRWEIETLFGCLKSRGFDFEATHIVAQERIMKMVALLAVAFCWCHLTGEWKSKSTPIKIKKHGRKAISYFRYGLDILRGALFNMPSNTKTLNRLCKILIFPLRIGLNASAATS